MKTHFLKIILICAIVTTSLSLSAQAGWIITNYAGTSKLVSGTPYYLKDVENGWHLCYKKRDFGINLGWDKKSKPNFIFEKQGGGFITCGDAVAIKVVGGDGYLKYESREWGINLTWSKTPVYQWEIRSVDNQKGSKLVTETALGLLNTVEKDFMIHCERTGVPVVDLGWFKDCADGSRWPGATNALKDALPWEKILKYGSALAVLL
ncbi:MAG: hypothetical protein JNK41_11075 [Saprospiraceae bacterium]|nr:hypothetical protein [Saprospiraceae bacterium]